jgi:hypothetical protein
MGTCGLIALVGISPVGAKFKMNFLLNTVLFPLNIGGRGKLDRGFQRGSLMRLLSFVNSIRIEGGSGVYRNKYYITGLIFQFYALTYNKSYRK